MELENGYGNGQEENENLGDSWQRRTVAIRSEAQRLLSRVGASKVPNWQTIQLPKTSRKLHEAILGYADMIRAKSGKIGEDDLWNPERCIVKEVAGSSPEVPAQKEGGYDLGYTDMYGNIDRESLLSKAQWGPVRVIPESLNEHWRISNEVELEGVAQYKGRKIRQSEKYRYYLPFSACVIVFCHLDECLGSLDWLPGGMKNLEGKITADGEMELYGR